MNFMRKYYEAKLSIRLSVEEKKALYEYCDNHELKTSDVVREALRRMIDFKENNYARK